MTDNSKKVSELPIAANVVANDRVIVLYNVATSASVRTMTIGNLANNVAQYVPTFNNTAVSYTWTGIQNFSNAVHFSEPVTFLSGVITSSGFSGTANNTLYVGSTPAADVVSSAQLQANLAHYTNFSNYVTLEQLQSNLSNYSTISYTNTLVTNSYSNAVSFANTIANTAYTNAVSYVNNKFYVNTSQLSSNLSNYQTTAGLSSNVLTLTANNTTFVGIVSAANVVSNAQLTSNLANYTNTSSLTALSYVNTSQLTSNLSNYQTTTGLTSNVAAYLPTYTGIVNGSSFAIGNSFTSNSTLVNAVAINVVNQTNTATLYATTSANIGTYFTVNSSAAVINVNGSFSAANLYVDTTNTYFNSNTTIAGTNTVITSNIFVYGYLSVNSEIVASNGLYSNSSFGSGPSYGDGIVVDYVSTNGRISVGSSDSLTFYTGGVGTTTMAVMNSSSLSVNGSLYISGTPVANSTGANNSFNLGSVAAANYVQNTDSRTLSGNLVFSGANVTFSSNTLNLGTPNVAHTAALSNGYSMLPNGLLMQWGTAPAVNSTAKVITFSSATGASFVTNAFSVTATTNTSASHVAVTTVNSTAITLVANTTTNTAVNWLAIGI